MGRIVWEQPGGSAGVQNWLAAASGIASGMADSRLRQGAVDLEADRFDRQRTAIREDQNALLDRQVLADQRRMQMQEGIDTRRQERDTANINLKAQLDQQAAAAKQAYQRLFIDESASNAQKLLEDEAPLTQDEKEALAAFRATGNDARLWKAIEDRQKRRANVEAAAPLRALVTRAGPPTLEDEALVRGMEAGQLGINDPVVRARWGMRTQSEQTAINNQERLVEQARNKRAMQPFITKQETLRLDALEKQYDVAASELAAAEREASNRQLIGQDRTAYLAEFQQQKNDAYGRWMNTYAQIEERVGERQQGGSRLPTMQVQPLAQPPQTLDPAAAASVGVDQPNPAAPLGTVKAGPNKGKAVGSMDPSGGVVLPSGRLMPLTMEVPPEVDQALEAAVRSGAITPGSLEHRMESLRLLDEHFAKQLQGVNDQIIRLNRVGY